MKISTKKINVTFLNLYLRPTQEENSWRYTPKKKKGYRYYAELAFTNLACEAHQNNPEDLERFYNTIEMLAKTKAMYSKAKGKALREIRQSNVQAFLQTFGQEETTLEESVSASSEEQTVTLNFSKKEE